MPQEIEPLLTIPDLSHMLGVPVDALCGWRHRGLGPRGYRVGRLHREVMTGRECREEIAGHVIGLRPAGEVSTTRLS